MIEIGKNFLWGLANAKQAARQEKERNKQSALQAGQQADALQQAYEEKMNYLFRSSAEKCSVALNRSILSGSIIILFQSSSEPS